MCHIGNGLLSFKMRNEIPKEIILQKECRRKIRITDAEIEAPAMGHRACLQETFTVMATSPFQARQVLSLG